MTVDAFLLAKHR